MKRERESWAVTDEVIATQLEDIAERWRECKFGERTLRLRAEETAAICERAAKALRAVRSSGCDYHSVFVEGCSRCKAKAGPDGRRAPDWQEKYNELLLAVASKYPGESRHETALRYIRAAENRTSEACRAVAAPPERSDK